MAGLDQPFSAAPAEGRPAGRLQGVAPDEPAGDGVEGVLLSLTPRLVHPGRRPPPFIGRWETPGAQGARPAITAKLRGAVRS